ncbi:MAG: J domain-containing protein [Nannocystales bacterium]
MTASEAFEILRVAPGADARTVKRAYHKLLKHHKPDSDPEGFRRLRDAFEAASEAAALQAFEDRFEESMPPSGDGEVRAQHGYDEQASPVSDEDPGSNVDPAVVHDALDRDELRWAFELVMDDRWGAAMLGDHDEALRWATRRLGLLLVLQHRPTFDLLASKYPEAFDSGDEQLVYLLRVSGEWLKLAGRVELPPALVAFATRAPVVDAPEERRVLARALGEWFERDVARGIRLMDSVALYSDDVAPFLCELALEFDAELAAHATGDAPAKALRVLTWPTTVLAVVVPLVLLLAGRFGGGIWAILRMLGVGGVLGFIYGEGAVYEALPSLRRRFLLACIEAGLEPSRAAAGFGVHLYLRRTVEQDEGLELGFHIGRLAQLGRGS